MKMPHLDRLASQGMTFERAYCQVAVCNPSRSSVLSGARADTTGVLDNQHFMRPNMPDVVTLPQHFKNHGYTSLSLGKIFHHSEREPGDDPQSWSAENVWHVLRLVQDDENVLLHEVIPFPFKAVWSLVISRS